MGFQELRKFLECFLEMEMGNVDLLSGNPFPTSCPEEFIIWKPFSNFVP